MKRIKKETVINTILLACITIILLVLSILNPHAFASSAESTENNAIYTEVLADLQKDGNFSTDKYANNAKDYSLKVVQIAESSDKELFLYVFSACWESKTLTAISVRMAQPTVGVVNSYQDYPLSLLSSAQGFSKYKVEGITIGNTNPRYYELVQIERAFDKNIDTPTDTNTEQTVHTVSYSVAQYWTVSTVNGETLYTCQKADVVVITDKIVGYIEYPDGINFTLIAVIDQRCNAHFIAFSTDWKIDDLVNVKVHYGSRKYFQNILYGKIGDRYYDTESLTPHELEVEKEEVSNDGSGLFGKKYTWNRISSVSDFISERGEDLNLYDAQLADLIGKQWIVSFTETLCTNTTVSSGVIRSGTEISEVTIFELTFITDGESYTLGVVDNKVTGSKDPFASADDVFDDFMEELREKFEKILRVVLIAIIVIVVVAVLSLFFPIVGTVISAIFKFLWWLAKKAVKAIWWIICLPFNLIAKLFKKKNKEKKNEKQNQK